MKKAITVGALALSSLMPLNGQTVDESLEGITDFRNKVTKDLNSLDSLTNEVDDIIFNSSDETLTYLGTSSKMSKIHYVQPLEETSLAQAVRDLGIVNKKNLESFSYGALVFKLNNTPEEVRYSNFSFVYNSNNDITDVRYNDKSVNFTPEDTLMMLSSDDPVYFGGNNKGDVLFKDLKEISDFSSKESLDIMDSYFNDMFYNGTALNNNSDSLRSLNPDEILLSASTLFNDEESKKIVDVARFLNSYAPVDSTVDTDSSYTSLDSLFQSTVKDTSMSKYSRFVKNLLKKNKKDSTRFKPSNEDWFLGYQRINDPGTQLNWVGNGNGLVLGKKVGPVWFEYSFANSKLGKKNPTETVNEEGLSFTNYGTKDVSSDLSNNYHVLSLGIPVKDWNLFLGVGLENKLVEETTKVYEEISRNGTVLASNSDSYIENSNEQNNILNVGLGRKFGTYEVKGNALLNLKNNDIAYGISLSKLLRGKK